MWNVSPAFGFMTHIFPSDMVTYPNKTRTVFRKNIFEIQSRSKMVFFIKNFKNCIQKQRLTFFRLFIKIVSLYWCFFIREIFNILLILNNYFNIKIGVFFTENLCYNNVQQAHSGTDGGFHWVSNSLRTNISISVGIRGNV